MDNEILYREFWIRCTKDKLIDLSEDLVHDARVEDFDKMESDICKSDAKYFLEWLEWVLPMLMSQYSTFGTVAQNRIRMMKVMRSRLARRLNKT